LSASLTTTPTKVYDRTDAATVTNAMVTVSSGYAGGDGSAVLSFSAATYASRNAGDGQTITFASAPTVVAQSSAGTGGKPVSCDVRQMRYFVAPVSAAISSYVLPVAISPWMSVTSAAEGVLRWKLRFVPRFVPCCSCGTGV
jgi:hypothetical protein